MKLSELQFLRTLNDDKKNLPHRVGCEVSVSNACKNVEPMPSMYTWPVGITITIISHPSTKVFNASSLYPHHVKI